MPKVTFSDNSNKYNIPLEDTKTTILQRLRANAPKHKGSLPSVLPPVYTPVAEALDVLFAQQFGANGGKFMYCVNQEELVEQLQLLITQRQWQQVYCAEPLLQVALSALPLTTTFDDLLGLPVSITTCEALVARTGTICLSSKTASGRAWSIVPPVHIVVATTNQLVYELRDILSLQTSRSMPSMLCLASTNSRTADIEKTLVNGAHGPKELFVFLLDN